MQGYIDGCQQADVTGWAVDDDGEPAELTIEINGEIVGTCQCEITRPDVAAAGFHPKSGFKFRFPRAVGAADREVAVKVNGVHLGRSPSEHHVQRVERFGYEIPRDMPGMELGALSWPFLSRPTFNVDYVDHASVDDLKSKYLGHFDESILPTDIIWAPGMTLSAACRGKKYYYAVASHVVEHVADPIGWMGEIAGSLVSGGRLNLAVPEKTRTFDADRVLSTAADMVDAFRRRLVRPDFRQVFDFIVGTRERTADNYRVAFDLAISSVDNYIDAHCHVWTYESFLDCWETISSLSLIPLRLDKSWAPVDGSNEFIVSFVRV